MTKRKISEELIICADCNNFANINFSNNFPSDEGEVQVELRYYSAANHGTYTSQSIAYSDGAILGTILTGYQPTWK